MLIPLLFSFALAHEGHNHAPHGPYKVVKREKAWLECNAIGKNPPRRFASPFDRAIFHQVNDLIPDTAVLLGPNVTIKEGDVLAKPILATEACGRPFTMTCNERGQPSAPEYRATLKDVFCSGKFNFVLAKDADK